MSKRYSVFFLFFMTTTFSLVAQVKISSPVSILGFGQLFDESHMFMQTSGNAKASFHSPDRLNIANPASLAALQTTVFSGGIFAKRSKISDNENSSNVWSGNIGYLALGMPLQNRFNAIFERKEPKVKWGMNFSLRPFSVTGYDFIDVDFTSGDTLQRSYIGQGSTYVVSMANGWKYKNLSFGVDVGYLFGGYDVDRTVDFPRDASGSGYTYTTNDFSQTNYRAFYYNTGLMYDFIFGYVERADGSQGDPNKYLTLGLTYHGKWKTHTETDASVLRQNRLFQSTSGIDTLSVIHDLGRTGYLPGTFNVGATYTYKNNWKVGVNYEAAMWSDYDSGNENATESTDDAFNLTGGIAYTPNATSITNFFERVTYSVGLQYGKDPRVLNGEQLERYSINVGFSFPFVGQRQISYVDLKFAYGRLGTPDSYKENYFSFGFGYTLTDNQWFIKRKYD